MNGIVDYGQTQCRSHWECQKCGEMLSMQWSADGLSGISGPHTCAGPSIATLRRIIREELKAALDERDALRR